MAIIGALPVTLTNGTTADATQVMADFNSIVSQVNANGAALAGGNTFTGTQTIGGDIVATLAAVQSMGGKTLTGPNGTVGAPTYSFATSSSTGMWEPTTNTIGLATNGVNAFYIDVSQNIGIRVVPSPWGGSYAAIEMPNGCAISTFIGGVPSVSLGSNNYYNGSNNIYKITGAATYYAQQSGTHAWGVAPSGTAGTSLTWMTALTLDNVGRLYGSALHNNATLPTGTTNQFIASGTYTPTTSAFSSVSSAVVQSGTTFQWIRVGNVVSVSGILTVVTTGSGAAALKITLPIPSSTSGLSGVVQGNGLSGPASIVSTSGLASVIASFVSAGSSSWILNLSYEVS